MTSQSYASDNNNQANRFGLKFYYSDGVFINTDSVNAEPVNGYNVGIVLESFLNRNISILTELNLSRKIGNAQLKVPTIIYEQEGRRPIDPTYLTFQDNINLTYIELPVLLKYQPSFINIYVGGFINYLVYKKSTNALLANSGYISNFLYGYSYGIGLQDYPLFIDLRFSNTINSLYKDFDGVLLKKTQLSLGYMF